VPADALPPRLRWLILTDNAIEALPDTLGDCARLQKLMLAGNRLRDLPHGLARCERLELLRISANRFERLPPVPTTLPRLAWLAIGGNPMTEAAERRARDATALPHVDWHALTLQALLGEGASGFIHEALWSAPSGSSTVAVKLFKGAVTSDGWPASEMAACIAAGPHPDLIPVLGRVDGHPDGVQGLVLARIPAGWRNLASPPSMQSCTRDIYADGWRLPVAAAEEERPVVDLARDLQPARLGAADGVDRAARLHVHQVHVAVGGLREPDQRVDGGVPDHALA